MTVVDLSDFFIKYNYRVYISGLDKKRSCDYF